MQIVLIMIISLGEPLYQLTGSGDHQLLQLCAAIR